MRESVLKMSSRKKLNFADPTHDSFLDNIVEEILLNDEDSDCNIDFDDDDEDGDVSYVPPPRDGSTFNRGRSASPLTSSEDDEPAIAFTKIHTSPQVSIPQPSTSSTSQLGAISTPQSRRILWRALETFEPLAPAPEYEEPDIPVVNLPPRDYFTKYIPADIYSKIAFFTNQTYLLTKGHDLGTSTNEIRHFIGITILMSHLRFPRIRMYWETKTKIDAIASRMSRDRYFKLRQWMKIVNDSEVTAEEKQKTKFWKVQPLINCVRNGCRLNVPTKNVSIDEQMIQFWGKHAARQMIKGKPNPVGLKNFVLTNFNGLPLDFFIYEGKGDSILDNQETEGLDIGGKVVIRLASRLPPGCSIFMDRYFTSIELLDVLPYSAQCTGTGTLQKRRIPKNCNFKPDAQLRREGRGSYSLMVNTSGQTACVKWFDNKPVILASNEFGCQPEDECRRWDKKLKRYVQVKRPDIVKRYNEGMGGVDYLDRMISYYRISARTRKWTVRLIFHLFDFSLAAAWIEYKTDQEKLRTPKKDILDYLSFRDQIVDFLLYSEREDDEEAGSSSLQMPPKKRAKIAHPPDLVRKTKVDHLPVIAPGRHRCRFPGCKSNGARYQCSTCKVVLCLTSERNCYKMYHEL